MPDPREPRSLRADGLPIHPGTGILPIVKEVGLGRLLVVGTGFYITRYGLVATAKHVIDDLVLPDGVTIGPAFVVHLQGDDEIVLRKVERAHFLKEIDVGVVQVDSFLKVDPPDALQNLRGALAASLPIEGSHLITYAYP